MEYTGRYYEPVAKALHEAGLHVSAANPLLIVMGIYLKCAPQDEPVFQFLDPKRSEGKSIYVYMTAASNKFLRHYYAKVMDYLATMENLPSVDTDTTGLQRKS